MWSNSNHPHHEAVRLAERYHLEANPNLQRILDKLGYESIYDLSPDVTYSLDKRTETVINRRNPLSFFGFFWF